MFWKLSPFIFAGIFSHSVGGLFFFLWFPSLCKGLPGGSDTKASVYNVGDLGSTPGPGRSSGEGNGNSLQYSCLENPMDGGASLGSQRVSQT